VQRQTSLRSNPESDRCTWIASQSMTSDLYRHLRLFDAFIEVYHWPILWNSSVSAC